MPRKFLAFMIALIAGVLLISTAGTSAQTGNNLLPVCANG